MLYPAMNSVGVKPFTPVEAFFAGNMYVCMYSCKNA